MGSAGLPQLLGVLNLRMGPPWEAKTASALAESMGLPPPNPMTKSALWARTDSTEVQRLGSRSGTVRSKTEAVSPASRSRVRTRSVAPVRVRYASVTSSGRCNPRLAMTAGIVDCAGTDS
jgi:hypothetical protein